MSFNREKVRDSLRRYLSIRSSYAPTFSSDDKRIAFISDATGVPQAWMVSQADGGGPERLTRTEERVGFITYARTKKLFAYGVDQGGDEHFQIRVQDSDGIPAKVTDNPRAIHAWGDWSNDESALTYSSNDRNPAFFDIYVHSLDSGRSDLVYQHDDNNYPVAWSPSGASILFTRLRSPFNHDLFMLDLNAGEARCITPHEGDAVYLSASFSPSGRAVFCVSDQGREFSGIARLDLGTGKFEYIFTADWDVEEISQSNDGRMLAFTVNEAGLSRLYVSDEDCTSPEELPIPAGVAYNLRWSNDRKRLAFTFAGSKHNPDIWLYDLKGKKLARLTQSSLNGISESTFINPQLVRLASFDGLSVPGFLYLPGTGKPPHPLVVYLHGGPESQFRPSFSPLIQFLLNSGFAVAAPNFRGSTGYGRKYTHLDDVRGRMDTVRDVHAFVEHLRETTPVDSKKIAAWGGSYGGFMVLACLYTNPDAWRAGVDIVGISNFVTFLKNTGPWRRKLRIAEYGDPERDKEFLESISPVNNAHLIRAPLFIIHGSNDPRVPSGEAEQIAKAMRELGREVHLLKFEDEGHGLVKLKNRVEGYTAAIDFLLRHLSASA